VPSSAARQPLHRSRKRVQVRANDRGKKMVYIPDEDLGKQKQSKAVQERSNVNMNQESAIAAAAFQRYRVYR
jgi:hypothetical protein